MGILTNPITLDALTEFIPEMTKLIVEKRRFVSTFETADFKRRLIESCIMGQVSEGYAIVFDARVALQKVNDFNKGNGNLFDEEMPQLIQETLEIDTYKYVMMTIPQEIIRQASASASGVGELTQWLFELIEMTVTEDLYQTCLAMIKGWTPAQATQKLEIELIDTSALTGSELITAELHNSKKIVKELDKLSKDMTRLTPKYQDRLTYKDSNDGTSKPIMTQTPRENMRLIINAHHMRNIQADTLSMLYNKDNVDSMLPSNGLIELPDGEVGDENTIGWFGHINKFGLLWFYRVAQSFVNAVRLKTNYYGHYSFGAGVFSIAPQVKVVAKYV